MKNKTLIALLMSAMLIFSAASLVSSAEQLKESECMGETLRKEKERLEQENGALAAMLTENSREETVMQLAEDAFGFASPQEIIFVDKG